VSEVIRLDVGRGGKGGAEGGTMEVGLEGIRILGYDHGRYFYLSPLTQQLVELAADQHSEANLCQLRELAWWADRYPATGRNRGKFDLSLARDQLMNAAHRVGPHDPELIRGRGVWWDDGLGRPIVHEGQWVRDGARSWRPSDAPFDHIYEASGSWATLTAEALDDDEAGLLLRLAERFVWVEEAHARLLAGWCVVAPVCGALRWRPHIALTGPTGSGKSFLANELVAAAIGPLGLLVEGETTSAGIRQTLGRDARPIVWDEAEPQGAKGMVRVQDALAFARSLSTAAGGKVIKGGANHKAAAFGGVGCMCLVSIYAQAMRQSDESRFTILELRARGGDEQRAADAGVARMLEQIDALYVRRLLGRTVAHLASLRASHERFAEAIEARWGSRRLGDQLGAMLAGAHLLGSTEPIGAEDAAAQVAELPDGLGRSPAGVSDEQRCLQRLTTWWTRVDTAGGKRQVTRSVGELVSIAARLTSDADEIDPGRARDVLLRHGVRVIWDDPHKPQKAEEIAVAAHHDRLLEVYRDTDFAGGWSRLLERLGGRRSEPMRFGPGSQARATLLPVGLFVDTENEPGGPETSHGGKE
jgi:putative DNA primase/helicase